MEISLDDIYKIAKNVTHKPVTFREGDVLTIVFRDQVIMKKNDMYNVSLMADKYTHTNKDLDQWLKNFKTTKYFNKLLKSQDEITKHITYVNEGYISGVYLSLPLLHRYAAWVSPKFFIKVIKEFERIEGDLFLGVDLLTNDEKIKLELLDQLKDKIEIAKEELRDEKTGLENMEQFILERKQKATHDMKIKTVDVPALAAEVNNIINVKLRGIGVPDETIEEILYEQ